MTGQDKQLTIPEVIDKLDIWDLNTYRDHNYIADYQHHFGFKKDYRAVLDIITKRALKIGLDPALVKEFREQSDLYEEGADNHKAIANKESANNQALEFSLDNANFVHLEGGKLYLKTEKSYKLLFSGPIELKGLVKYADNFKIDYSFDKDERLDTIDSMLTFIAEKLRLDRGKMQYLAQFLYLYKTKMEETSHFEHAYEPVDVDKDGVIIVNETTEQTTIEIMNTLSQIYKISTNPESYLTTLCYSILAPFSYDIRGKGEKFPYRMNAGKTHGGKTSDFAVVMKGFNRNIEEYKETLNTVKTVFTLGQKVEQSRFPFVIDDVSNQWLEDKAEILKGATDGVKFMARGTRDQAQNIYKMVAMPMLTMNAEPDIPLALRDRIIISHYSEKNRARQNKGEFEELVNSLKPGFMFNLIAETLGGKNVTDILKAVHYSVKKDEEINQRLIDYGYSLLKDLADRVGLEWPERPILDKENEVNILELLIDYVAMRRQSAEGQYYRDPTVDQKFELYIHRKVEEKDEIRITLSGYNDFVNQYRLERYRKMQDFINEINDDRVKIDVRYISHLKRVARCIIIPYDMVTQAEPDSLPS